LEHGQRSRRKPKQALKCDKQAEKIARRARCGRNQPQAAIPCPRDDTDRGALMPQSEAGRRLRQVIFLPHWVNILVVR
jgi:hypothetical protein